MRRIRVVIITGPGFEDPEVIFPYYRLLEEGFHVDISTSNDLEVKGKHGYHFNPTVKFEKLNAKDYDAVIIPGGNEAPDRVRQVEQILKFIKNMHKTGKIISSICHGPWVLISAGIIKGRKATCYPGMKDDLINAGALYKSNSVVVDKNIVTSDHPRNLAPWMKETIRAITRNIS